MGALDFGIAAPAPAAATGFFHPLDAAAAAEAFLGASALVPASQSSSQSAIFAVTDLFLVRVTFAVTK